MSDICSSNCSEYATCKNGECECNSGFKGNGIECVKGLSYYVCDNIIYIIMIISSFLDPTPLILGLTLGIGVPFLIVIVIIVIIIYVVWKCRDKITSCVEAPPTSKIPP